MTRNEKIALGIGAGVITFGGLAIYFMSRPSTTTTSPSPSTPQPTPSFSPTSTATPTPSMISPSQSPSQSFPPSWNQFTNVIAGHRYLVQLHSATPFDWSKVNVNAIPGSFTNLRAGNPSANYYSYTLDAHVSHQVQNVMFLLGLTGYIDVQVIDLGATP